MVGSQPHYASASLYVGDLAPDVNETTLYEVFSAIGPVASIRVCRESGTRRSLGYAYVNYHSIGDAERSLETLNYTLIKGVPCRIMWSHRDPSLRQSGAGNIFVKNLDKVIDNKALHDTFSLFGNILSCKVATDEYGKSKGYGFVHYESEQSAKSAIEKVNGMQIGSKTVFVGPFKRQTERPNTRSASFTNLYVKHFPDEWTEDTLKSLFAPFGTITSMVVSMDPKGRRFALVNFEEADSAKRAVEELHERRTNNTGVEPKDEVKAEAKTDENSGEKKEDEKEEKEEKSGEPDAAVATEEESSTTKEEKEKAKRTSETEEKSRLYVQRAMTKAERMAVLRETFSTAKDAKSKMQGVNLYVKNIDPQVTDDMLREAFSKFGTVTSAKVMRDDAGVSKGFGFVCFAFPEEATKAVTAMHLKIFHGKPLYVGLAEKRNHRTARLQQRYRMTMPRPVMQPHMMMGGGGGAVPSQVMPPYGTNAVPSYYGGGVPAQRPIPGQQPTVAGGYADPSMAWRRAQYPTPSYPYPAGSSVPGYVATRGGPANGVRPRGSSGLSAAATAGQNFKFTSQARNRQDEYMQAPAAPGAPIMHPPPLVQNDGAMPLSAQALAAAHPQVQKQILGERLFPLVHKHQPELAGKITGMMLEMDNAELLSLLESETLLRAKIDEALGVLHRHHQAAAPPMAPAATVVQQ